MDGISKITTRSEIFIVLEDKVHDDGFNDLIGVGGDPSGSGSPPGVPLPISPPVLNPREPPIPPEVTTKTQTKDEEQVKTTMTPTEIMQAK